MDNKKVVTVNMTYDALRDFIFRSYYGRFSGMMVALLGVGALVFLILGMGKAPRNQIIGLAIVAVLCLVYNPISLMLKAKKQLMTNPSYKAPITYEIDLSGITVIQGEAKELVSWKNIYRVRYSNKILAVYTSPYHAFVLPNSELGKDKSIIAARIVQYSLPYKPHLSGSLKEFRNDKDMSKNL